MVLGIQPQEIPADARKNLYTREVEEDVPFFPTELRLLRCCGFGLHVVSCLNPSALVTLQVGWSYSLAPASSFLPMEI